MRERNKPDLKIDQLLAITESETMKTPAKNIKSKTHKRKRQLVIEAKEIKEKKNDRICFNE